MKIEVEAIGPLGHSFEFLIGPDIFETATSGFRLSAPARFSGLVEKREHGAVVAGNIRGEIEVQCARCLAKVYQPLDIEVSAEFLNKEDFGSGENAELGPNDLDADVLDDGEIDLSALAAEQILLNVPEQYFCRPDCKGLCDKCGADLNLVDCSCGTGPIDPRWAGLKKLKDDGK
ncbi:MAG: DUF177 domain-containing protein [Pyrinomonadaceae bacterium]